MNSEVFPDFFDDVPKIKMHDPLAEFLGAARGGILQYGYSDAVRMAGHSCPTVAVAYWATYKLLSLLYPNTIPVRGEIRAEFSQGIESGATGVIANVVGLLTGAASANGFKGLAGRFDRRMSLRFGVDIPAEIQFTRVDTGESAQITANLSLVPSSPRLPTLMQRCLSDTASREEVDEFRNLWQARVRSILFEYGENSDVFRLTPVW